jgi:hypothetical protein
VRTSFYDVVVLGTGLEPLIAAALLGREGLRVLVLGQDSTDVYSIGGVPIDAYPLPLLGARSPVVEETLESLALRQDLRQRIGERHRAFQLLLPEHRVDVVPDESRWASEVEREMPRIGLQAADISRTLRDVDAELDELFGRALSWPPETFLERQRFSFASASQRYDRRGSGWTSWNQLAYGHPLRGGFEGALPHVSALFPGQHSDATRARLHAQLLQGVASVPGGIAWFREALFARVRSWGGDVRERDKATAIQSRGRRGHVVVLGRGDEEIGCSQIVHGTPVAELAQLIDSRAPMSALFERVGEPRARAYRCSVHLLVERTGVPDALEPLSLACPDPRHPERAFLIRNEELPSNLSLITATTLIGEHRIDTTSSQLRFVRDDAMEVIRSIMPFVDEHARWIDSSHDGLPPESLSDSGEVAVDEPGARGPSTMRALYEYPTTRALGVCALPTRTPVQGVFLCNDQVSPGLGFEGAFLTASTTTRHVAAQYRSRDWLRRGPWARRSV